MISKISCILSSVSSDEDVLCVCIGAVGAAGGRGRGRVFFGGMFVFICTGAFGVMLVFSVPRSLLGVDEDGITGGDTGAEVGGRFFGEEGKGRIGCSDVILCVVFGSSTPSPIIGRRPSRMALTISTALNLQYALYRFEKEMKTLVKDMMNIYIYIYIHIYTYRYRYRYR